jgi:hypothetical protein
MATIADTRLALRMAPTTPRIDGARRNAFTGYAETLTPAERETEALIRCRDLARDAFAALVEARDLDTHGTPGTYRLLETDLRNALDELNGIVGERDRA